MASNLFSELLLNIHDQFNILPTTLQNRKEKLDCLLKKLLFNFKKINLIIHLKVGI
jgi:hypothetical protein